jgi:hypothetical protein
MPNLHEMELSNDSSSAIRNKQEWVRSCEKNAALSKDPEQAEEWRAHARYEREELHRMEQAAAQKRLEQQRDDVERQRGKERRQQEEDRRLEEVRKRQQDVVSKQARVKREDRVEG